MKRRKWILTTALGLAGIVTGISPDTNSPDSILKILSEPFSTRQVCADSRFCYLIDNLYRNVAIADYEIFLHKKGKNDGKSIDDWVKQRKASQNEVIEFSKANSLPIAIETLIAASHEEELKRRDFFENNGQVLIKTEMLRSGEPTYIGGRIKERKFVSSDAGKRYKVILYEGTIPDFFKYSGGKHKIAFQTNDTSTILINQRELIPELDCYLYMGANDYANSDSTSYKPDPISNASIALFEFAAKNNKKILLDTITNALIAHEISHMEYKGDNAAEDEALAIIAEFKFPNQYTMIRLYEMKKNNDPFFFEVATKVLKK